MKEFWSGEDVSQKKSTEGERKVREKKVRLPGKPRFASGAVGVGPGCLYWTRSLTQLLMVGYAANAMRCRELSRLYSGAGRKYPHSEEVVQVLDICPTAITQASYSSFRTVAESIQAFSHNQTSPTSLIEDFALQLHLTQHLLLSRTPEYSHYGERQPRPG